MGRLGNFRPPKCPCLLLSGLLTSSLLLVAFIPLIDAGTTVRIPRPPSKGPLPLDHPALLPRGRYVTGICLQLLSTTTHVVILIKYFKISMFI